MSSALFSALGKGLRRKSERSFMAWGSWAGPRAHMDAPALTTVHCASASKRILVPWPPSAHALWTTAGHQLLSVTEFSSGFSEAAFLASTSLRP